MATRRYRELMGTRTALIGIDWGTTSFRAYRMDRDGAVLGAHDAPAGILQVDPGGFDDALERELGPDDRKVPVIASGMITSRQGWVETPYLDCPADAAMLARGLTPHTTATGRRIWFVNGLTTVDAVGIPDVMRGEETQIVGCGQQGLFVLPGTHSKWALAVEDRIEWFATFMTGELFTALKDHTILGRPMRGDAAAPAAFKRGVEVGLQDDPAGGGLLRRLFSTRTHGLFGNIEAEALSDYLSGLLIGAEIREADGCTADRSPDRQITLIGRGPLIARYDRALRLADYIPRLADEESAARGHFAIARMAGLI